jgi:peptidoglycan/LPS O-acetylase OafA/YrhL
LFQTSISTSGNTPSISSYRPEIDGLRALAVIAVIINHFNKTILPSGYLGVDIFFVISGYVITSSLAGRSSKDLGSFLISFYVRRIKRLLPALILFVVINSALISLFNPNPELSLKTGIASLFGLSNLYLLKQATDYFATATELNVFTHTWSLGLEEQFYMVFPLVIWFAGFSHLADKGSRNLFKIMGVLSLASLISFVILYHTNQPAAYFLMPTRLWELGVGCLIFLGLNYFSKSRFIRFLETIPPLIIIVAIIIVLCMPMQFTIASTISIVILTAILIASIHPGTAIYQLFTHKYVVYIGLISYSLYLWHWSVLSISRWTIGISWWTVPIQLTLMMFFCIVSYKYLETPLRRSVWTPSLPKTVGYGLSASISAGLCIFLLYPNAHHLSLIGENREMSYKTHWEGWSNCKYVITQDSKSGGCKYIANKDYPLRVVVIGDSHAGHLASGLRDALPSIPSSMAAALYAGCYPVVNSDCTLTQQAFKWVLSDPEIDVVVLAGYHNLVINGNRLYKSTEDPNTILVDSFSKLEENLKITIKLLTDSGKNVLMIVDSHELLLDPELEIIPMSGLVRDSGLLDVSRQSVIARNQRYYQLLDEIAAENPHFTVF